MLSLFINCFIFVAAAAAQRDTTVCVAGQCLQGKSNITQLGGVLSTPDSSIILLPGQYTPDVTPANLQQALVGPSSTVSLSTGFSNSTASFTPNLPLNIALLPGLLSYPADQYVGDPTFQPLPTTPKAFANASRPFNRGSILLSSGSWAAIQANNGGPTIRTVIWDNVPYISQLPSAFAGTLTLTDLQSSACTPACASNAVCTSDGKCLCSPGFTGDKCESCANGFFGPECKPCPEGCTDCDQGSTGSGVCLSVFKPAQAPSNCNCVNGVCSNGSCQCNVGWANASNGTACATCAPGFFLNAQGGCQNCSAGCDLCRDGDGQCTKCRDGLTPNSVPQQCEDLRPCGGPLYRDPSGQCLLSCHPACATCTGPGAQACTRCSPGFFSLGDSCVAATPAGVCQGESGGILVADRILQGCSTCPTGCSNCQYPNNSLGTGSTLADVQCTTCLPGFFLLNGKCVDKCPEGQTVGQDGSSCTVCNSSCKTCAGSANFCLTCASTSQLAFNGGCTATCPSNTFSSNGACLPCHPDCATCTGAAFNQCSTCPPNLPVRTSDGRCVPTCSRSEWFEASSGSCKPCHSSCGSCSGGSESGCLSCARTNQVLRAGKCVDVDCGQGTGTVANLGICLAEIVQAPNNPTVIPPVDENAQNTSPGKKRLEWWQILLIVLGCVAIVAIALFLWRRRSRKKRAEKTEQFANNLKARGLWSRLWRSPLGWFGRRKRHQQGDIERSTTVPDTPSTWARSLPGKTAGYDRATVRDVPRGISMGSWMTMEQHTRRRPSIDGRSHVSGYPETTRSQRYQDKASSRGRSRRHYDEPRESQYGREIDQYTEDGGRTEVSYDLYAYTRSSHRSTPSDESEAMSKSHRNRQYTKDRRYDEYPSSPNQRSRSRRHHENDQQHQLERSLARSTSSSSELSQSQRPSSPSIYSTVTGNRPNMSKPKQPVKDLLTSRFSMTTVGSAHPQPLKKSSQQHPMPDAAEPPRQLTEAEMYKLSRLFSFKKLIGAHHADSSPTTVTMVDRNPFRQPSL